MTNQTLILAEPSIATPANLVLALDRWRKLLGNDRVLVGETASAEYGANTIGVRREIPAALRPRNTDDVVNLVRVAAEYRTPIYPISTGNNWGYGAANPVVDGCVIVDTSHMNAIRDLDPQTGVVTIEPGVTQGMLRAYLNEHDYPFLCPVSGAGPDCSLVGNALDRGYGITPYADHFFAVMSLEAVLPDGSIYRSPLTELGAETVDNAFKWGLGPYLDGMFTQGAFGVVTKMAIALAPAPARVQAFFFGVGEETQLEDAVVIVRKLLREIGSIGGSINLMNARRVLSMMEPYPHSQVEPGGIISNELLARMAKRNQVHPWIGAGALYGNAEMVRAARRLIKRELRGTARRLMFHTDSSVKRLKLAARFIPGQFGASTRRVVTTLDKTIQLLSGLPSEIALPLAYWKSGVMPPSGQAKNPARDGCGLLWYSPLVPMMPDVVRRYTDMVERICIEYRMEPLITLTSLSDRLFDSTVPLLFDRESPEEVERAHDCYKALFSAGKADGLVPYRTSVQTMHYYINPEVTYWRLVRAMRELIDPHGIISPGRYAPLID